MSVVEKPKRPPVQTFRSAIREVMTEELQIPASPIAGAIREIIREEIVAMAGRMREAAIGDVEALGIHPQHLRNMGATARYGVAGAIISMHPEYDPYRQEEEPDGESEDQVG